MRVKRSTTDKRGLTHPTYLGKVIYNMFDLFLFPPKITFTVDEIIGKEWVPPEPKLRIPEPTFDRTKPKELHLYSNLSETDWQEMNSAIRSARATIEIVPHTETIKVDEPSPWREQLISPKVEGSSMEVASEDLDKYRLNEEILTAAVERLTGLDVDNILRPNNIEMLVSTLETPTSKNDTMVDEEYLAKLKSQLETGT